MTNRYDNYSNEFLADEIGYRREVAKQAADYAEELSDEAKRRGIESASGRRFIIRVSRSEQTRLDTKALRAAHPKIAAKFDKVSTVCRLTVDPLFQKVDVE